ncbi:MAG: alpha/beta fold hydrolase [Actinomycetia bacterium]|nr:alpha/beta fold hydrolase [Actinomycetes bacterium]
MTRIPKAALVVVSAVSLGLGTATVGVPSAQAAPSPAPDVAALAGDLAKQQLTWEECDFGNASYNERWAKQPSIRCASVTVPRDWHNPKNGKTWSIRISHVRNIDPSNSRSKGVILGNPGGPGGAGLVWGPAFNQLMPDVRPYYNFVGMDPRGVGQSSKATCDYTFDKNSSDPYAEMKAVGSQCAQHEDVRTITTEQTVYDMDFIRHLLGQKKLGYAGFSYGTWLGAWYGNVFAANAGPMLLDSSTDVTEATLQRTWDLQPIARDRQFDMHLMNWMARQDDTYKLGQDPSAIKNRYYAATDKISADTVMLVWLLTGGSSAFPNNKQYPAAADTVKAIIEFGESQTAAIPQRTQAEPAKVAQHIIGTIAANGKNPDVRSLAASRVATADQMVQAKAAAAAEPSMVTRTFKSTFEMIRCGDGQWTQGERYWKDWIAKTAPQARLSASWGLVDVPVCAFWQTNTMMPGVNRNQAQTVVVQGELDSQTAYETGYTTGTRLPRTSAIFIDNEGSHGLFPYGSECVDRPVINFFLNGRLPANITTCQGLPLPNETKTYESWAKLDPQGKHVVTPAGPWTPAETASKTLISNEMIASEAVSEMSSQFRTVIQSRYGTQGVQVLEQAGVLT